MSPVVEKVMYDDQFQNACQRYAHNGGSSGAIAQAAVNALSKIDPAVLKAEMERLPA